MVDLKTVELELNDGSIFERLEPAFAARLQAIPKDYMDMSETGLRERIAGTSRFHLDRIEMVRTAFWKEHEASIQYGRPMKQINIWKEVCSRTAWTQYMDNYYVMAYVLTPPTKYELELDTLLRTAAYPKLKEILGLEGIYFINKVDKVTGEEKEVKVVNVPLLKLQVAVIKQIEDRVKGMSIQRVQTHEVHEHKGNDGVDMKTLDSKIIEIENKLGVIQDQPKSDYVEAEIKED